MADITNPQAIIWSNSRVRVFADSMIDAYESAKKLLAEWSSLNMATLIPNNVDDVLIDGAASDGRSVITGDKVNSLIANATAVVSWFEAGTPSRIDRFRQISINGRSRF